MAGSGSESAPESDGVRTRRGNNSAESSVEKKILSAILGLNEKILSTQCKRIDEQDNVLHGVPGRLDAFDEMWSRADETAVSPTAFEGFFCFPWP